MSDTDREDEQPLAIALRDLLQSDGWRWLWKIGEEEFGPAGYGRRLNAAIAQIPAGPDRPYEVAKIAEQIHAECQAVNALLSRPKAMLDSLTKKPTARPFEQFRRTLGAR